MAQQTAATTTASHALNIEQLQQPPSEVVVSRRYPHGVKF